MRNLVFWVSLPLKSGVTRNIGKILNKVRNRDYYVRDARDFKRRSNVEPYRGQSHSLKLTLYPLTSRYTLRLCVAGIFKSFSPFTTVLTSFTYPNQRSLLHLNTESRLFSFNRFRRGLVLTRSFFMLQSDVDVGIPIFSTSILDVYVLRKSQPTKNNLKPGLNSIILSKSYHWKPPKTDGFGVSQHPPSQKNPPSSKGEKKIRVAISFKIYFLD